MRKTSLMSSFFSTVSKEFQSPSHLSVNSPKCDKANPGICQQGGNESEVKRMIQILEQQASSALQGKCVCALMCHNPKQLCSKLICIKNTVNIRWIRILSVQKLFSLKIFFFQTTPEAQFKLALGLEEVAVFGLASSTF